jgi:hypothetical protein
MGIFMDNLKDEVRRLSFELEAAKKELEATKRIIRIKEIELDAVIAQAEEFRTSMC